MSIDLEPCEHCYTLVDAKTIIRHLIHCPIKKLKDRIEQLESDVRELKVKAAIAGRELSK